MQTHITVLTDQEKQIIQEVQMLMGFETIEETIEYLAKQRIRELLFKLAGKELRKNQRHFF